MLSQLAAMLYCYSILRYNQYVSASIITQGQFANHDHEYGHPWCVTVFLPASRDQAWHFHGAVPNASVQPKKQVPRSMMCRVEPLTKNLILGNVSADGYIQHAVNAHEDVQ